MAQLIPQHTCFLVDDLEKSIVDFSGVAGTAFGEIREMPMRMVGHELDVVEIVRFVYSVDGTIELVQGTARGVFGPDVPRGIHHIGRVLDTDLDDTDLDDTVNEAGGPEWTVYLGDWKLAAFLAPTAARPVRVELVSPDVVARAGTL